MTELERSNTNRITINTPSPYPISPITFNIPLTKRLYMALGAEITINTYTTSPKPSPTDTIAHTTSPKPQATSPKPHPTDTKAYITCPKAHQTSPKPHPMSQKGQHTYPKAQLFFHNSQPIKNNPLHAQIQFPKYFNG